MVLRKKLIKLYCFRIFETYDKTFLLQTLNMIGFSLKITQHTYIKKLNLKTAFHMN